ncbi:hypothetical protein [Meiothermus sp.]|uniref:hypothetical protein n=1 Tax=Meiothermus sp. TaxID=1955249 RepID=UPI0021DDF068|nr:hypothetical protein [Meiothermus sp.]GIW34307.1 MAG: hypothetical protein KatS3mg072_1640 [Meiothermus sp.]
MEGRSDFWLSIVGSALALPLARTFIEEGPARGAAILGLVGAGLYTSLDGAISATAPQDFEIGTTATNSQPLLERYRRGLQAVQGFKGK